MRTPKYAGHIDEYLRREQARTDAAAMWADRRLARIELLVNAYPVPNPPSFFQRIKDALFA